MVDLQKNSDRARPCFVFGTLIGSIVLAIWAVPIPDLLVAVASAVVATPADLRAPTPATAKLLS